MAHARESVRKAIITAVTGLTTTGSRVGGRLIHTQEPGETPSLSVIVAGTAETKSSVAPDEFGAMEYRDLPVTIEARVYALSADPSCEDTLDDICQEVETAIQANAALLALISELRLVGTTIEVDGEGERPVGLATMEWLFTYRVDETAPTAAQP